MRPIAIAVGVLLLAATSARADVRWRSSFRAAHVEASSDHKLLFVEFTVPG